MWRKYISWPAKPDFEKRRRERYDVRGGVVERGDPNKNYICFVWGFALTLDIQKIRG